MSQVTIKQTEQTLNINIDGETIIINNCCAEDLRQAILDKAQKELYK